MVDVDRSLDFELKLGYNDIDCDVVKSSAGKFSSEVVIQVNNLVYSTCIDQNITANVGKFVA